MELKKDFTIRIATKADARGLLDIYSYYVNKTAITFEYSVPDIEEFKQRIENTLQKYPYLVAERELATGEKELLGYCYAGSFKNREAYNWSVETSIYLKNGLQKQGLGKALYTSLEEYLIKMNIVNMNACITFPHIEDQYLTKNSFYFHKKMGFTLVGEFTKCGYKFNRWYNMIWMEKLIGKHLDNQPAVIPFKDLM